MDKNLVRSIIFFIAGFVTIIFKGEIWKIHHRLSKKFNLKQSDSQNYILIFGITCLVIALILFFISQSN